jgi:hypothetical protein
MQETQSRRRQKAPNHTLPPTALVKSCAVITVLPQAIDGRPDLAVVAPDLEQIGVPDVIAKIIAHGVWLDGDRAGDEARSLIFVHLTGKLVTP